MTCVLSCKVSSSILVEGGEQMAGGLWKNAKSFYMSATSHSQEASANMRKKKLHYECSQEPVTNWELGDVRRDSPGSINAVIAKTAADL